MPLMMLMPSPDINILLRLPVQDKEESETQERVENAAEETLERRDESPGKCWTCLSNMIALALALDLLFRTDKMILSSLTRDLGSRGYLRISRSVGRTLPGGVSSAIGGGGGRVLSYYSCLLLRSALPRRISLTSESCPKIGTFAPTGNSRAS